MSNRNITSQADHQDRLVVGVDLAKRVFQVAYRDPSTGKMVNKQMTRAKFHSFVTDKNRKLVVAFEACGSANYWGRVCEETGQEPRILLGKTVKAMVTGNKDDRNDAYAIWQLANVPGIQLVHPRSEENQVYSMLMQHRNNLIEERTKLYNQMYARLYELGIVSTKGEACIVCAEEKLEQLQKDNKKYAELFKSIINADKDRLALINRQIKEDNEKIEEIVSQDESCQLLMTIPFIGPVNAFLLRVTMDDPENFKSGRDFAAYCGVTPSHSGTGGKIVMGGLKHKGNHELKAALFQASLAMFSQLSEHQQSDIKQPEDQEELQKSKRQWKSKKYKSPWIRTKLQQNKPSRRIVCAIMNRLCRIAYGVIKSGKAFDPAKTSLVRILSSDKPESVVNTESKKEVLKQEAFSDMPTEKVVTLAI